MKQFLVALGAVTIAATLAGSVQARTIEGAAFLSQQQIDWLEAAPRGQTTQADVLFAVGQPTGRGGSLFPTASETQEIWYYEAVRIKGRRDGAMRQQIILVFFEDNRFDGYMWFDAETPFVMRMR